MLVPDFVVAAKDSWDLLLVAEAKLVMPTGGQLAQLEDGLRSYMFGHRCGVGLLIAPGRVRIYRETYRSYDPSSIELLGDFECDDLGSSVDPAEPPAKRALAFEERAQRWLEGLHDATRLADLPAPLRQAIEEHVSPLLERGEIRAAHPRFAVAQASERRGA